jgi:CDP-paratose 2-epimerase
MRYLITGGAGFIGCNAAARFKSEGHDVLVADNFSRGGSSANAAWLAKEHQVAAEKVELRDPDAAEAIVKRYAPEVVLHCAAQVAVTTSVTDPRSDFLDNALGTFNVLEAVRKHAPKAALLYTSTNKVYGGMEDVETALDGDRYAYKALPFGCGEDRPLDFHSPYGCSKGAADQYVRDYARIYGLRTVVFRQSCIYGYRQFGIEDQGWVAWFTIRAAQRGPITIFGDGKQVRDVLFIDDLVSAFGAAIDRIDRVKGQVFNIGGGPTNTMSLLELVKMLGELSGRPLAATYADWRPGDQRIFVCDVRKAERDLGWSPKVGVTDGVAKLYAWVSANMPLFAHLAP